MNQWNDQYLGVFVERIFVHQELSLPFPLAQLAAMIRACRNHPSVARYSICNDPCELIIADDLGYADLAFHPQAPEVVSVGVSGKSDK